MKDNKYSVGNGHYMCHPETCTCHDWEITDPKGKHHCSSDDKEALETLCDRLNAKGKPAPQVTN